ncbi:RNA recognition motif domain-containing protein [Halarcobacter ebronensis]|uniref:RNA-binding protein n=1 Tax=Halarcobacter ebronensis TaxID=1462615 RepID=A0A4Q1AU00_9BACT|nr:RNA-binding protein [Halarcobacter ebronensis]QKF80699.1 RNA-binding protein [Halarcobacter ebronensis]RXK08496.1 RNA-binding protein [Halarcobacter ebronensis]
MNIYVGNLSYRVDDEGLKSLFEKYGEVKSAKVITDRETGRSKGFGFVEMMTDVGGGQAIEELNGSEYEGRSLRVNEAKPKESKPRRQF